VTPHTFALLAPAVAVAVQFVLFLRWLHRRMRDDEVARAFLRDIALNHLPHIYTALHEFARQQGIELREAPMINYVDFNGRRGKH
jgi:hypothetical protein